MSSVQLKVLNAALHILTYSLFSYMNSVLS